MELKEWFQERRTLQIYRILTAVPYNAVPLDAATAGCINGGYAAYNGGIQAALLHLLGLDYSLLKKQHKEQLHLQQVKMLL